jgi:hypothetical protein
MVRVHGPRVTAVQIRQRLKAVWRTGACNVHELPHVVERAVVLATGPMLEAPDVWLSSLGAALPLETGVVSNPG